MCGICGVVQIGGEPRRVVAPEVLDRMTDSMTHRGPNDRGTYAADGVALGARRLSIVDVAGGHQPVSSEDDRVWAAQNGELYNHLELRAELERDHGFRSRCDTEILPHLYERDGVRFCERLRGKFAIAVWDERRRRAVLVRDRLGIKPLYYALCDDLLVFGSELKAVLASGLVAPALDYEAIDAYLTLGFFPAPRTPLAGVSKLMPGERLIVDERGVRTERYWEFPRPGATVAVDPDEAAARVLAALDESVRLRLMSDVPLGAMLSGGLDSSLVVALMARHMREPVKTFSVGFVEAGPANELADAREVAALLGTDHHELELSVSERSVDLAELVWAIDEPLADLSTLGFLALCELASRDVTVALSGQGADELFGGYPRHGRAALAGRWRRLPRFARQGVVAAASHVGGRVARGATLLAADDAVTRQLLLRTSFVDDALRNRLVRGPLALGDGGAARRAVACHAHGLVDDPLGASLYLDAQLGLVDDMLHYFDRASMAHSLEVRVPFLDHHVVELAASLPNDVKVRGRTRKDVLKRAARGLVPDRIIDKPKIGFFNAAVDQWFHAQADGVVGEYLLDPGARFAELLDRGQVTRMVADEAAGVPGGRPQALLAILMLEVWLSSYLPHALAAPAPARDSVRVPL